MTGNYVGDKWRAPLDDLRTLRESLRKEEQRVSYWRQLVHGPGGAGQLLAGLEGLWDAPIAWDDPPALHRLERGLVEAEVKLSPTAGPCTSGSTPARPSSWTTTSGIPPRSCGDGRAAQRRLRWLQASQTGQQTVR